MIATLLSLLNEEYFVGGLKFIQHCFQIFLGGAVPAFFPIESDVGDVKGDSIGMRTDTCCGISVSLS